MQTNTSDEAPERNRGAWLTFPRRRPATFALGLAALLAWPTLLPAATATLLGWNNLGMHCMDSDYSVFSVLPPYNTIESQLVVNGLLVTNPKRWARPATARFLR